MTVWPKNPKIVVSSWQNLANAIPYRLEVTVERRIFVACPYCRGSAAPGSACTRCMGYGLQRR